MEWIQDQTILTNTTHARVGNIRHYPQTSSKANAGCWKNGRLPRLLYRDLGHKGYFPSRKNLLGDMDHIAIIVSLPFERLMAQSTSCGYECREGGDKSGGCNYLLG